jgi:hypothetical protein
MTRRRRPVRPILALLLLASAAGAVPVAAAAGAPATWRLDYFHTGGPGIGGSGSSGEIFAVDRVVVEPLPWPGHPAGNLDTSGTGLYRFRVLDAAGRAVYSRGFNSIFGEWETTAEAGEVNRTFHESLRFPGLFGDPPAPVTVVVEKRGPDGAFHELWRTTVDPADPFVDPSPPPRQELIEVERHGEPRSKVDVLLLGDGYTAEECAADFRADARRLADVLFAHEPFHHRRSDFNVWGLCPPSAESGVSRPSTGRHRRTPVGATYDAFGSERYLLTFENRAWRDVAAWAPYELVEILANNETYGGGGIYNLFATVAIDSDWSDYVFIHELGHHFAGLADEYYTSPVAYEAPAEITEPWEPNVTALSDPAHLKWGDLVAAATPIPTLWPKDAFEAQQKAIQARRREIRAQNRPEAEMSALFREERAFTTGLLSSAEHAGEVGAFQGANYDAQAFYRPQIDCVMFTRDEVPFCAVCQRALEEVIDRYAPGSAAGR